MRASELVRCITMREWCARGLKETTSKQMMRAQLVVKFVVVVVVVCPSDCAVAIATRMSPHWKKYHIDSAQQVINRPLARLNLFLDRPTVSLIATA